jgi:hypothetical protein
MDVKCQMRGHDWKGLYLSYVYDLSQFSVSWRHVKSLAESAAVVELVHRLHWRVMAR